MQLKKTAPVPATGFAVTLTRTLEHYRLSVYRVAEDADLDRPYLWRLATGRATSPGRTTVMGICYGLARNNVSQVELDSLLIAAGYAPAFLEWKPEKAPGPKSGTQANRPENAAR